MLTRRFVDSHLVAFEPERVLPILAPNIRAMHENRAFIRLAPCTDFVIGLLARLVVDATDAGIRFRTYECLRTIRQIIRYSPNVPQLSPGTGALLFRLYQHYVYSNKEEVQWCVSVYLKDRELDSRQIDWLIANASTSVHLVNRLLRYPKPSAAIASWGRSALRSHEHTDRTAELLALLITDHLPKFATKLPTDTLIWAAYYSRSSLAAKSKIIRSVVTPAAAESALEVARRLRLPEVIRHVSTIVPNEDA